MIDVFSIFYNHTNIIINILMIGAFVLNIIFAFIIIFMERRSPGAVWAWILILAFIPILGFIIYLLFGRQIQRDHIFRLNKDDKVKIESIVDEQLESLNNNDSSEFNNQIFKYKDMIQMLLHNNSAFLTTDNDISIYTDGKEKFNALIKDIYNAKNYIHIQYYIFRNDKLGKSILAALEHKLEEGLEVKMLYDDMGSRSLSLKDFDNFRKKGGHFEAFFPSKLPLINLRMNNRNHRKIVIIDGYIGYVGGFNVGDEYLGVKKKFGYWRDTHLRIIGDAVNALQLRFMLDWNSQSTRDRLSFNERYYPIIETKGKTGVQIASSGPDETWEQIKYGYLKIISSAKKSIFIQSPYFIPDQAFLDTLKIAALSGVDVNIMIPNKPDHPFVYWATYNNVASLLDAGVNIFHYNNGFLHSKTLIIDDEVASVGTTNMDHRSFTLNFEINAFIYDTNIAKELRTAFEADLKLSYRLTKQIYEQRSIWVKFKEGISRLLSPLL
ncbi:cardiolipin synthase [Staphylococcus shinii]|uniref:cardiolipin synthase n=1 Tax=Staphylococcus shinii TaxID=2912228 RepID=UPI003F87D866